MGSPITRPRPAQECLDEYRDVSDQIIDCITRLHAGPLHPLLLPVYHGRALLATGKLDEQRNYLELERAVISRYYPDEGARQDAEIMHMVQHKGAGSA